MVLHGQHGAFGLPGDLISMVTVYVVHPRGLFALFCVVST
jgi:hypothetical protein